MPQNSSKMFSLIKLVSVEHTEHTVLSRISFRENPARTRLAGHESFKMAGLGSVADSQWLPLPPWGSSSSSSSLSGWSYVGLTLSIRRKAVSLYRELIIEETSAFLMDFWLVHCPFRNLWFLTYSYKWIFFVKITIPHLPCFVIFIFLKWG